MANTYETKVFIMGSGPAGYTAAIYASRAGLEPMLVSGPQVGGQLTSTSYIENYPGFESISGFDLMEKMRSQSEKMGARLITDTIVKVDFHRQPFTCIGETGDTYIADTVIIATGASAKYLGLDSETKYKGFGVSACATCDGFFYRGKDVVIIGGGNTAVEDALFLTNIARSVKVIHRRDALRAEKIAQERLFANPKVEVVWDSVPVEILGEDKPKGVTGLKIRNVKTGEEKELKCDGIFIAIGHNPNTEIFQDILSMDISRYITTVPGSTATNIKGVFAAGDVKEPRVRQAVMAAGSGCQAAIEAERYLFMLGKC